MTVLGVASFLLLLLFSACQLQAHTASTHPVQDTLSQHQLGSGVDGLFGAMGTFATDLGMHALHLLLSGSDDLLLNEGGIHGVPSSSACSKGNKIGL